MVKDAEAHQEEDAKRKEVAEARNQAEALVHSTEATLAEAGDKVPAEDKTAIEAAVAALKTALEGDDAEDINAKTQELVQLSMKMGEAMYSQEGDAAPEGGDAGADAEAGSQDDDIVDADFEEVDEDKKKQ